MYDLYRWDMMIKMVHLSREQQHIGTRTTATTIRNEGDNENRNEQEDVIDQRSLIPEESATYVQQVFRRVRTFAAAA